MDRIDVEMLSASLVREYLARKKLMNTLKQLDEEQTGSSTCVRSRLKLLKALHIGKLMKRNKQQGFALDSMVEVIVHFLLEHARDPKGRRKVLQSNHQDEHTEEHIVKLSHSKGSPQQSLYQEEISIIEVSAEEKYDGKVACAEKESERVPVIRKSTKRKKLNATNDQDSVRGTDLPDRVVCFDAASGTTFVTSTKIVQCNKNFESQNGARQEHHKPIELLNVKKQHDKETQRRSSLPVDSGILTREENSVICLQDCSGSALEESGTDSDSESSASSVIDLLRDMPDGCENDCMITTDVFRKETTVAGMSDLFRVNNHLVDTQLDEANVIFAWMNESDHEEVLSGENQTLDVKEHEQSEEEIEEIEKWASERPEKHDRSDNDITLESREEESEEEPERKLPSEEEEVRVVFESDERQRILAGCREDTGNTRGTTVAKTLKRRWLPKGTSDAGDDTTTCAPCPKASTSATQTSLAMESIPEVAKPRGLIDVDLCSLPDTCDGYGYMAVAVDSCTDWLEAEPLKTKSAENVAQFLFHLISRHGRAKFQIHHDQGRQFVSSVSTHLHALTGVKERINGTRHPRGKNLTGRSYKTIQSSMLKVLEGDQDDWPKALPGGYSAYRTSKEKATGCSPFYLLYDHQPGPSTVGEDNCEDIGESAPCTAAMDDSVTKDMGERRAALKKPRSSPTPDGNISPTQEHQTRDRQKHPRGVTAFNVGDDVFVRNPRRQDRKMKFRWYGPYKVHEVLGNDSYELETPLGNLLKRKVLSVNMKTCSKKQCLTPVTEEKMEEEPVRIVGVTNTSEAEFQFLPTSTAWRTYHARRLGLPEPKIMVRRTPKLTLTPPESTDAIEGDGNCFFRAMSFELTGSEANHMVLRESVVAFMSSEDNSRKFSSYSGEKIHQYLESSGMADGGTWATDVEIIAMATMLQTVIFVFTELKETKKWLPYKPLFKVRGIQPYNQCIYLSNLSSHFERVFSCS